MTDLQSIVLTVQAVLQVQVCEAEGDLVGFGGAPSPLQPGGGLVAPGEAWGVDPARQRIAGPAGGQEG